MRAQPRGYDADHWRQLARTWGCWRCRSPKPTADSAAVPVEVMLVMEAFGRRLVLEPYLATVVLAGGCLRSRRE